jgi:tape measure domain-containing protein
MAANRIFIQVDFQTQGATTAINSLNENIKGIGSAAQDATEKGTAGVKGFSVSVDQARAAVDSLAQSLTGLGIAQIAREILALGDAMIRMQFAFEHVRDGTDALRQLQGVAEETGFSLAGLLESANDLKNAGVPIREVAKDLKIFADQAAFAGKTQDQMNNAVEAFAKLSARPYVTGRELLGFKDIGIDVLPILAEKTGLSIQKLREDMHRFSASAVQDLILVTAQAKSMGAAAELAAQLPSAQFNKLKSDIALLSEELVKALTPGLITVIGGLRSLVDAVRDVVTGFQSLPEWLRTLAVSLAAVAIAAKAAAVAFALWGSLPAAFAWLPKVTGVLSAMGAAMLEIAAAGGTFMEILTPMALTVETLITALTPLGVALLAAAAAFEAFEYARYRADTSDETTARMKKAFADRQKLAEEANKLYESLPKAQQEIALKARSGHSYESQTIEDLQTQIQQMRKLHETLIQEDEKAKEEAIKRASDLLDEANKRSLMIGKESIAGLTEAYKVHFRSVAGFAQAEAIVRKALEVDIATEGKKADEERRKDHIKYLEELLSLQRKVAIAQANVVPDDTFAGRVQQARAAANAFESDIREHTRIQNEEYDRRAQLQIDTLRARGGTQAETEIAGYQKRMLDNRVEQNAIADEKVAEHRLQMEHSVNQLLEEERKQLADQALQDQLTTIEQTKNLRVAALGAVAPDSLPEKLRQMREIQQANIEAIQQQRDARIAAAKHEYDYFQQQHPGATENIAEEYAKFEHVRITTAREAEVQIQLERINLWKESNDAIIAEQKKVYDGIKSALDKVWDALLNKSQSVWAALGNALKTAVLNAMKEIVTSRLAATIAGMFGYGTYTFKRGIGGIYEPPSPSGIGTPLDIPGIPAGGGGIVIPGSGGGQGSASRSITDEIGTYVRAAQIESGAQTDTARMQARGYAGRSMDETPPGGTAPAMPPAATGGGYGGGGYGISGARPNLQQTIARMRDTFNIGKPITVADGTYDANGNPVPAGGTIPWSSATGAQRLGAILKSPAAAQIGLTAGTMLAMAGLQRGGPVGGAETITGATMAGVSAAFAFPALGLTALGGGLLGAGLGVAAYGLQRGGKVGAVLSTGGGALAGAVIGTAIFPGLGTLAGAAIGAGVGAVAGVLRMAFPTLMERVRSEVKRVYGVDIPSQSIRKQIADIVTQKYGGNLSIGVYSQEVQDIVRLYAVSTGQSVGGLPRPMYSAAFAESQAGGLQLQPVYSNGQLIANPYVGTTTTQLQNALFTNPAVYMQLHPQQAADLFSGQVVKVMGNNPGAVAQANATATRSGQSRLAQTTALMEPMTVTQ